MSNYDFSNNNMVITYFYMVSKFYEYTIISKTNKQSGWPTVQMMNPIFYRVRRYRIQFL
jgi:hypothetical protein